MRDLSVIIPARKEMFLRRTVEDVLSNIRADTEIIVLCDEEWPDPPLLDHPRVIVVHHTDPIGQRALTNEGVRISQAKYVMKLDAHCSVGRGFDAKLIEDCRPDWTLIPQMYNLHVFDWVCQQCEHRTYQGSMPVECGQCQSSGPFQMDVVWERQKKKLTVSWRFDDNLQFQYWRKHKRRLEKEGPLPQLIETMSFIGACMFLERERYWYLGGLDENHGSWGQFGTEFACKSWLSGGKLVTTRNTWFAHLFRTGNFSRNGECSWPYEMRQEQIDKAREYSRDFWMNDRWDKQVRDVRWLVEKFKPVPDWHK